MKDNRLISFPYRAWRAAFFPLLAIICLSSVLDSVAAASSVDVRLSTTQAYVGAPILLQVTIRDAAKYTLPDPPMIDGVTVEAAGSPSQSSRITIINGKRQFSESVIANYRLVPERPGEFTVPSLTVPVDGVDWMTDPISFSVSASETGDLLIVEIEGDKPRIYIGETLTTTLRIWIKPFRDVDAAVTLPESAMWTAISERTHWGPFQAAIDDMREKQLRPRGRTVQRDTEEGPQIYTLFEIETEVTPQRSGPLDAGELKVVVDYPTEIGRRRDMLDDFFGSAMGRRSPLSRMLDDDFGGFGGLAVTATRPIQATVATSTTTVVPVPEEGRPANYRGAVGRFEIAARAQTTDVAAGDTIPLDLQISGDGALDSLQPPPLSEQTSLTDRFKVDDSPLAGFVRDESKMFTASIRPRDESVSEIPPIEFSFFDPATESFETVLTQPIPIEVRPADVLSLDAITGPAATRAPTDKDNRERDDDPAIAPELAASDWDHTASESQLLAPPIEPIPWSTWLAAAAGLPPLAWGCVAFVARRREIAAAASRLRPARFTEKRLAAATQPAEVATALLQYGERVFPDLADSGATGRSSSTVDRAHRLAGQLRLRHQYPLAAELESIVSRASEAEPLEPLRQRASDWLRHVESKRPSVLRPRGRWAAALVVAMSLTLPGEVIAGEPIAASQTLRDAQAAYQEAIAAERTSTSRATDAFAIAAASYAKVAESIEPNATLLRYLADAQWKAGDSAGAIANYHRSFQIAPNDRLTRSHLELARAERAKLLIDGRPISGATTVLDSWDDRLGAFTSSLANLPAASVRWLFASLSVVVWSFLIVRTLRRRRLLTAPMIAGLGLLLLVGGVAVHVERGHALRREPIVVFRESTMKLRSGDGESFPIIATLTDATAQEAKPLRSRAGWVEVELVTGVRGWLPEHQVISTTSFAQRG